MENVDSPSARDYPGGQEHRQRRPHPRLIGLREKSERAPRQAIVEREKLHAHLRGCGSTRGIVVAGLAIQRPKGGLAEEAVTASNECPLRGRTKATHRGGPVSGLRIRSEAADAFLYPDVMVSCDPGDQAARLFLSRPVLVVEVLSESTAAFDRGDKFAAYRTIESLREYVLLDIPARRVEVFRRTGEGDWLFHEYLPGCGECLFPAPGVSIPFDAVFENVEPPGSAEGPGPAMS
jgi:hypothetical protein